MPGLTNGFAPVDFPCDSCGADVGHPCTGNRGRSHIARRQAEASAHRAASRARQAAPVEPDDSDDSDDSDDKHDPTPCCLDPGCPGNPCTFPGYADNH